MLVSHMESKEQRWPNVRLGDVSAGFNYGISDMMMNNLWLYDFNILEEAQHNQISGFPEQGSSEFTVSNPDMSSGFVVDMQQNRENDDPNSMKAYPTNNDIEMKPTEKCIKGPRSKRCRRTVYKGPWNSKTLGGFMSTPSMDHYGSIDNQGSSMSKRSLGKDVSEAGLKIQKGGNLESNAESSGRCNVSSVGRWLEDVGFGRYAGVFEMHEVDEEALPLLTFDDLKEMGVLAVGPRRKLYAAICGLRAGCDD